RPLERRRHFHPRDHHTSFLENRLVHFSADCSRTRLSLYILSLQDKTEAKKKEEIRQVQLQFFTNVSHEFRTPLTLILGPLERMMKEEQTPFSHRYFQTMHRNAQRLLGLIN